jgi:hypothetical protein
MLDRFGLREIKPTKTLIVVGHKLGKELNTIASSDEIKKYQQLVGCISYLNLVSRPDVSHVFSVLSQFLVNPNEDHLKAAYRAYAYLRGTMKHGLHYSPSAPSGQGIQAYVDSDWAGSDGRRSTTGWILTCAGAPISWSSKRQSTVALSSCEAEYITACEAGKELIWFKGLLDDLKLSEQLGVNKGIILNIDNESAIKLTKNPEFHARSKHIDLRYHWIREKVESSEIIPRWVPTKKQLADGFTKALGSPDFRLWCGMIGLKPMDYSSGSGEHESKSESSETKSLDLDSGSESDQGSE